MPIPPSYPGVYIQDLPGGQHTINPVATSITAFIGRAPIGPTDEPLTIFNFGDYQRFYGGLAHDYPMSYAVQDFFLNGGSEAIIVRLFEPRTKKDSGVAQLPFQASAPFALQAASPGTWGNFLSAKVDTDGISSVLEEHVAQYGLGRADLFNLTLVLKDAHGKNIAQERYLNVTVKQTGNAADYPNRLDHVLNTQSNLARVATPGKTAPSPGAATKGSGGNDGTYLKPSTYIGNQPKKTGMYLLDKAPLFNLLCIPPDGRILPDVSPTLQDLDPDVRLHAAEYCVDRRALFIVDPPTAWIDKARQGQIAAISATDVQITGKNKAGIEIACNTAIYFPRVYKEDLLAKAQLSLFPPCGIIAGVMAATDVAQGVWKAPAGTEAGLAGVAKLEITLTDDENGQLNPQGINCLRSFPVIGPVVWGARTLRGADIFEDDYKYIPVRRLMLFIEESLYQGTQWAAFEPNDETLWLALRQSVETFLAGLAMQGAFYDYKVVCDATTTTPEDITQGIVNILVQVAPVKPAEFVVLQIQQMAGQPAG